MRDNTAMESILKVPEDGSPKDALCLLQCVDEIHWKNSTFRPPSTNPSENKELAIQLLQELLTGIDLKATLPVSVVAAKGVDAFAEVKWGTTQVRLFLAIRSRHSGIEVALMIDQLKSTLLGRKLSSDNERAKQVRALVGINFLRLFSIEPAWISFARFEQLSGSASLKINSALE